MVQSRPFSLTTQLSKYQYWGLASECYGLASSPCPCLCCVQSALQGEGWGEASWAEPASLLVKVSACMRTWGGQGLVRV